MAHWPFKVVKGDRDKPMIELEFKREKKRFILEEISAMVLAYMMDISEAYIGKIG